MRFAMFIYDKNHMVDCAFFTDDYDEEEIGNNKHLKHLRNDVKYYKKQCKIRNTVYAEVINEKGEKVGMVVA